MSPTRHYGSRPYDPDARRPTPIAARIKQHIRDTGPLTMRDFVSRCLADPEYGYYQTQDVIGHAGDFTTAPEISQIFGELIGLWCAVVWQQMGCPANLTVVELGPGRGTLMQDALRATANLPDFHDALSIVLVEHSDRLRAAQAEALRENHCPVDWRASHLDLFESTFIAPDQPTIVIANEFFDALPADTLVCLGSSPPGGAQNNWMSKRVILRDDRIVDYAPTIDDASHALLSLVPTIQTQRRNARFPDAKAGDVYIEQDFAPFAAIMARLTCAAALVIDYGHTEPALGDTLQAIRNHAFEHPMTSPGEADLSYQVGFGELAEALVEHGLAVDGPVTQAEFLGSLGLAERASRLMAANPARANEIETASLRLIAPNAMGTRFKVLAARSPGLPPLPGLPSREDSEPGDHLP